MHGLQQYTDFWEVVNTRENEAGQGDPKCWVGEVGGLKFYVGS